MSYEDKVKECENYLKSYDIQNDNCFIKATVSGYFYTAQDLKTGSFTQEGTTIGTIYLEAESKYYEEIYVGNNNIAQIKEGQDVKFEIAAYPSSEYGYFEGIIENIAKDIPVDQSTGYACYLVRVKCDNMTLKGKDGEEAALMNGMACQAKNITLQELLNIHSGK
ncbi:MAG: HlyD family efflux transporter periplasmic adaptor subunit [Lachnospiraceae bacterium]|nr:HlyD family efflux transporter periplasmic adaptor subunit [Lachnospiraceae bacterium]